MCTGYGVIFLVSGKSETIQTLDVLREVGGDDPAACC